MKMKQYEMGERFIVSVERQPVWSALDAAWQAPDHLPTLAEIGSRRVVGASRLTDPSRTAGESSGRDPTASSH